MRHGDPDMTESFQALSHCAVSNAMLKFKAGWTTHHRVPNYFQVGMDRFESKPYSDAVPVPWVTEDDETQPIYQSFDSPEDALEEAYLEL